MTAWLVALALLCLGPAAIARQVPQSRAEIALSFAPVVRQAAPAVVNIYTRKAVPPAALNPFAADPFFRFFFEGPGRQPLRRQPQIGSDEAADLARLDIEGEGLPILPMGDSDSLEVGDLVLAIGNPFGIGHTVTSGVVSALARSTPGGGSDLSFIQTDAAINPGNSGGALVTLDGALVGINTAIFTRGGGSIGIGFAILVNLVKALIRSVEGGGQGLARAWLGAALQPVAAGLAATLGLSRPVGVLVNRIYPGGPAARAGLEQGVVVLKVVRGSPAARLRLRPGDRVSTLAERRIADVSELARVLQTARPPWRLEILRDGRKLAVVVG